MEFDHIVKFAELEEHVPNLWEISEAVSWISRQQANLLTVETGGNRGLEFAEDKHRKIQETCK